VPSGNSGINDDGTPRTVLARICGTTPKGSFPADKAGVRQRFLNIDGSVVDEPVT
jgi:hypothetical protein